MTHIGRFGVQGATATAALAFTDGTAVSVVEEVRDESLLAQRTLRSRTSSWTGVGGVCSRKWRVKAYALATLDSHRDTCRSLGELMPQLVGAYVALVVVRLVAGITYVSRYRWHMHQAFMLVGQLLAKELLAANAANRLATGLFGGPLRLVSCSAGSSLLG